MWFSAQSKMNATACYLSRERLTRNAFWLRCVSAYWPFTIGA